MTAPDDLTPESEALLADFFEGIDLPEGVYRKRLAAIERAAIARDREEDDRGLELRWDADMRAIKRWQAAHPEQGEVWPDHADMVVWLLDEWLAMRVAIEAAAVARDRAGLVEVVARHLASDEGFTDTDERWAWLSSHEAEWVRDWRREARRLLALDAPEAQAGEEGSDG